MAVMTFDDPRYFPVQCDAPLPCPFCGEIPRLCQLSHTKTWTGPRNKRREVKIAIVASTRKIVADTFWFKCDVCGCQSGGHHDTAQKAAEFWNTRKELP